MQMRWDTVPVGGDAMRVYVALPDGDGPFPGVAVMQGRGGVEETIQTLTRRLADAGFAAAAPELYHRQKDAVLQEVEHLPPGDPERASKLAAKAAQLRDEELIADGAAAVALLRGLPQVDARSIGVIGFCQGGRTTYLVASAVPGLGAVVPFYPSSLWVAGGDGPPPIERTAGITAPLLGIFGGDDQNPSPQDAERIDAELTKHGKPHELSHYAGAGHDFMNFRGADRYREEQAAAAWAQMLTFLRKHLRAPAAAGASQP